MQATAHHHRPPRAACELPQDVGTLHGLVRELESALHLERLARERAESKLRDLLRRLFGPSSEKLDPNQYRLALEQVEADQVLVAEVQPPAASAAVTTRKRPGGGRRPAPDHLPIERIEIDLPEEQKAGLIRIREEITEELDYEPSRFIRRHFVRPVYAHPEKAHAPVVAPLPVRVLPQAAVGPGLLAHVLVSKYLDHLPLHRQEKIAARVGVELPRQKLCRWVEGAAHLLRTVHGQLATRILASGYVQVDETPIRVLDPDRGGHAAQAYLWPYLAPTANAIVFDFNLSRGRDSPEKFFPDDWGGVLQSDGYELYASFARRRPQIVHAGCMAHLRRHLVEALDGGGEDVAVLLAEIGVLYRLEKDARERALDAPARAALREAHAQPILARLERRFEQVRREVLPQSALGKAAAYALNHWPALCRYARPGFGHVLIDNNSIERGIRPTKLGAKNWIFIGHPDAGWRSAVIYSVIGTCQLLGVNPQRYLAWVLPKLAAATTRTAVNLLPHDFAALPVRS